MIKVKEMKPNNFETKSWQSLHILCSYIWKTDGVKVKKRIVQAHELIFARTFRFFVLRDGRFWDPFSFRLHYCLTIQSMILADFYFGSFLLLACFLFFRTGIINLVIFLRLLLLGLGASLKDHDLLVQGQLLVFFYDHLGRGGVDFEYFGCRIYLERCRCDDITQFIFRLSKSMPYMFGDTGVFARGGPDKTVIVIRFVFGH